MNIKCPYCQSEINENEQVCHSCQNDLTVQCQYCHETIKAYDEVCPKCLSRLRKRDYSGPVFITGVFLNILWILGSVTILILMGMFPQVFKLPDEDSLELLFNAGRLCVTGFGIILVPYIILIVKNYKRFFTIGTLIFDFILAVLFIFTMLIMYIMNS